MDKIENWLYIRTVSDEANDDGDTSTGGISPGSICIPASSIQNMEPVTDTALQIHIKNIIVPEDPSLMYRRAMAAGESQDSIKLTVTQGKMQEVMEAIAQACHSYANKTGFIVLSDVCTTTDSATTALNDLTIDKEFLHSDITSGVVSIGKVNRGRGIHEYYEVVTPMTADDNDVAASLSIKLPARAVIVEAALTSIVRATNDVGSVALEVHSAAIADDSASAGTEIVGADVSGNVSSPDADCDISSTGGEMNVHIGNLLPVSRGADETFFHVCAKEDMSSMTGTPKVGVYIRWWGDEAVIL